MHSRFKSLCSDIKHEEIIPIINFIQVAISSESRKSVYQLEDTQIPIIIILLCHGVIKTGENFMCMRERASEDFESFKYRGN